MGYADTLPYQQITLKSALKLADVNVTTAVADFDIGTIYIPSFKRPVSHAYLEVHAQYVFNDSAATNYLTATGQLGIVDSTATFRSGGNIGGYAFFVDASEHYHADTVVIGTTNIASYIEANTSPTVRLNDVRSNADSLRLYETYGLLRLYFNV